MTHNTATLLSMAGDAASNGRMQEAARLYQAAADAYTPRTGNLAALSISKIERKARGCAESEDFTPSCLKLI